MRFIVLALLAVSSMAYGQSWGPRMMLAQAATAKPDKPADKKADKKADEPPEEKAKPRPSVGIRKDGPAGQDATGSHGGAGSLGGTPSTPSGSFTRP